METIVGHVNYGKFDPNFQPGRKLTLLIPQNNNEQKEIKPIIAKVHRSWKGSNGQPIAGDDLAIIQFDHPIFGESYIPLPQIISRHSQKMGQEKIVDSLANKLWSFESSLLYAMGWGSQGKFQFSTIETDNPNSLVNFATNLVVSNQIIPTYNYPITNADQTKSGYSIWLSFEINHIRSLKKILYKKPEEASLPNYLEHTLQVESGDSGGPIFVCQAGGISCYLIGITSGNIRVNQHHEYEVATTLANPFYDEIREPIN